MTIFLFIIHLTLLISFSSSNNLRSKTPSKGLRNLEFSCTSNADCGHGTCVNSLCECNKYYVTYIKEKDDSESSEEIVTPCNHKVKKQLTALMLSIFVGFGSEHFYMGNVKSAAGKFMFYIFCYYLNIALVIFYACFKKYRHLLKFIGIFEGIYMGIGFAFMVFWNLYDWIKIGINDMPDSKGFKLYSWDSDDNGKL